MYVNLQMMQTGSDKAVHFFLSRHFLLINEKSKETYDSKSLFLAP